MTVKIALLGYGTVGEGVYKGIENHREQLMNKLGEEIEISGILVHDPEKERDVPPGTFITTRFEEILAIPDLQVVFEAIVGEEPGFSYLSRSIEKGCHVITANKVMFAKYGSELLEKGRRFGVHVGYEATAAGAIPIIRTLQQLLQINRVSCIQGILNGTSNFILSQMRVNQHSFQTALELAQKKGFAEADPENDINGTDAACKLIILSQLAFGKCPSWDQIAVEGITSIQEQDVREAEEKGLRYKHIAEVRKENGRLYAFVKPVLIDSSHPLYGVEGSDNAIALETSLAGQLTLQGPGAGKFPTASAMIEDFSDIIGKSRQSKVEWQTTIPVY